MKKIIAFVVLIFAYRLFYSAEGDDHSNNTG